MLGDCKEVSEWAISIQPLRLTHQERIARAPRSNADGDNIDCGAREQDPRGWKDIPIRPPSTLAHTKKEERTNCIGILDVVPAINPTGHPTAVGLARDRGDGAVPRVNAHHGPPARERQRCRDLERARAALAGLEREADRHGSDGLEDGHGEEPNCLLADGERDGAPDVHAGVARAVTSR